MNMNNDSMPSVVSCAFQICCYYFLKCLLPPIKLGSHISLFSSYNYDEKLNKLICKLKKILSGYSISEPTHCQDAGMDNDKNDHKVKSFKDYTKVTDCDPSDPNYDEIKRTITEELTGRFGEGIEIDFQYENCDDKNKTICALKIKEIGTGEPCESDFNDSEIYINKGNGQFYVKSGKKFKSFPLTMNSVLRCKRN